MSGHYLKAFDWETYRDNCIKGMLQSVENFAFFSLLWKNEIHQRTEEAVICRQITQQICEDM